MLNNALFKLVKATRLAYKMDEFMNLSGYGDTPYADIYGKLLDCIYELLNENTDCLEQSVAYKTITDPFMTAIRCSERILEEYQKIQGK